MGAVLAPGELLRAVGYAARHPDALRRAAKRARAAVERDHSLEAWSARMDEALGLEVLTR